MGSGSLSLWVNLAQVSWPRPPDQGPAFPVIGPPAELGCLLGSLVTGMPAAIFLTTGGSPRDRGQGTDGGEEERWTQREAAPRLEFREALKG